MNEEKFYAAVVTEKTSPYYGQKMYNTKNKGQFHRMTKEAFAEAVKASMIWGFELKEI